MRRDLMRRDLMRHDRRVPVSDSEQTALALQAYQIFADNVLELSLLNLSTGEYRVIKRDPRLPGAGSDTEEDFAAYCERMVTNKVIHPDDAEMFTDRPIWRPALRCFQHPAAGGLPLPQKRVRPVRVDHHGISALPQLLRPEPMGHRGGA